MGKSWVAGTRPAMTQEEAASSPGGNPGANIILTQ
jgi:hypothetical protein